MLRLLLLPIYLTISFCAVATEAKKEISPADYARLQIESLPEEDIWWTKSGETMLWSFKNLHTIFPTVTVHREGEVKLLERETNNHIGAIRVPTKAGIMELSSFLDSDESTAISLLVLHKGKVVYERYPRMKPYEKPVHWSVTKIMVSSLVGILEAEGKIDTEQAIEHYIPELADSDFQGIKIINILDMATGLNCPEEYIDKSACYYVYSAAIGDGYWDERSPDNPYEYVSNLRVGSFAEQGAQYDYSGINTFVLGWLVEKATGLQLHEAVSQMIWSKIGVEADASFFAPRFGVPVMHGGLLARPIDLAKFGLLFTPSYQTVSETPIISKDHIEKLLNGGRPELLGKYLPQGAKHNIYQWDMVFEDGTLYKGGWAGQGIMVNPVHDYVFVWNSYFKDKDESETKLTPIMFFLAKSLLKENK